MEREVGDQALMRDLGEAAMAETDIAIVGLACHLPGAADADQFWQNLRDGVESIRRLSAADLAAAGEAPQMLSRPITCRPPQCWMVLPISMPISSASHRRKPR